MLYYGLQLPGQSRGSIVARNEILTGCDMVGTSAQLFVRNNMRASSTTFDRLAVAHAWCDKAVAEPSPFGRVSPSAAAAV